MPSEVLGHIGHHSESVVPGCVDRVCSEKFRHSLAVPGGDMHVLWRVHEAVREFVQDQMTAVVIGLLLVHPEFQVAMAPIQKGGQTFRQ